MFQLEYNCTVGRRYIWGTKNEDLLASTSLKNYGVVFGKNSMCQFLNLSLLMVIKSLWKGLILTLEYSTLTLEKASQQYMVSFRIPTVKLNKSLILRWNRLFTSTSKCDEKCKVKVLMSNWADLSGECKSHRVFQPW